MSNKKYRGSTKLEIFCTYLTKVKKMIDSSKSMNDNCFMIEKVYAHLGIETMQILDPGSLRSSSRLPRGRHVGSLGVDA